MTKMRVVRREDSGILAWLFLSYMFSLPDLDCVASSKVSLLLIHHQRLPFEGTSVIAPSPLAISLDQVPCLHFLSVLLGPLLVHPSGCLRAFFIPSVKQTPSLPCFWASPVLWNVRWAGALVDRTRFSISVYVGLCVHTHISHFSSF